MQRRIIAHGLDALAGVFDVVAVVNVDTTIEWSNAGFEGSIVDLLHPVDADRFLDALGVELSGAEHPRAFTVRIMRGEWRCVEVLLLTVPGVHGVVVTMRTVEPAADEHLLRALASTATDITTITDLEGHRLYTSPVPLHMPDEFVSLYDVIHPDDLENWSRAVAEAEDEFGGVRRLEVRCRDRRGVYRWVEAVAVNLHDDPAVGGLVVHCRDIHDRRQAQDALSYRALHDPLTGLPNRTYLHDHLTERLGMARTPGLGVTVMFCDLDGFKDVNDRHGHATGDEALNVVAQRVKGAIRPRDFLARFGGDEFCVVSVDFPDSAAAALVAERVRTAITEPLSLYGARASVGVSIGIAWSGEELLTGHDLIRRADEAMYRAKANGRNRVEFALPCGVSVQQEGNG